MTYPPDHPSEHTSDRPVSAEHLDPGTPTYRAQEFADAADPAGSFAREQPAPTVFDPAPSADEAHAPPTTADAAAAPAAFPSAASMPAPDESQSGSAPEAAPSDEPDASAPAEKRKKRSGMGEDPAKLRQTELPDPPPLSGHGPAVVLAVCNQKGGVGKTTTTINLGSSLAEFGRRVLLVDFDPQGALSVGLGVSPHDLDTTIYNLLVERSVPAEAVVMRTSVKGLDLLPSNIDLSAAEIQLVNEVAREQTLERVLRPLLPQYDYILVDCQPSLGLLTVNALTAARGVLIPLECEYFSLRGVALLIDTVEKVRDRLNPDLDVEGILATMYDPRTIHAREVFTRIVEAFGDKVFQTTINRTVRFPETTVAGEPITSWAPTSPAAEAYRNLAREILARDAAQR